jgi:ribosomal protein S18 acetylase RimI-like enzyme
MEIRKGRKEDLETIKEISLISLKAVLGMKYFEKHLNNSLVAVEREEVIGFIIFKNGYIMNFAIQPEFRKMGIGKKLIGELMKKNKTIRLKTRENNKEAIDFFKKLGFREKSKIEHYYFNGENAIKMELKI